MYNTLTISSNGNHLPLSHGMYCMVMAYAYYQRLAEANRFKTQTLWTDLTVGNTVG